MKNNIKRAMMLFIAAIMMFSNSIAYGTSMTSNPQIKTRGLVFNTGKASDQIRLLKDFFRERGDSNVPWGYIYDNRTKELVSSYQRSKGLGVDGIAGSSTIDRINKDIRDSGLAIGLRIPTTSVKGDMLIINKSSNTIYLMNNGAIKESYPVATGKTTDLTPSGRFSIVVKYKNPAWGGAGVSDPIAGGDPRNPLGTRWIGISYGGGGRYGVHGNANPGSIGTYASLGCVRMFNSDVEKLYDKVKTGIPIWMGQESELESYGVRFKSNYVGKPTPPKPAPKPTPPKPIKVQIDGQNLQLNDPIVNKNGRTYYPFREVLEFINADVEWDSVNKKAIGRLDDKFVEFTYNENEYKDNQGIKKLPNGQKVFMENDKTYIPIRNVMISLGYDVTWNDSARTIVVKSMPKPIKIEIDGEKLELKDPLINKDGTTYYPFREVLEFINAEVEWDDVNKKVIGTLNERYVEFKLNSNEYTDSDGTKNLPSGQKVFMEKDKTYIPIRNVMESLGYTVTWNESTNTILIKNTTQEIPMIPLEDPIVVPMTPLEEAEEIPMIPVEESEELPKTPLEENLEEQDMEAEENPVRDSETLDILN